MPTVEWKRENGNKSMTPKEHSRKGAVLSIDSVSEDDFGIYFCVAVNSKNVAYAYVKLGKMISCCSPLLDQSSWSFSAKDGREKRIKAFFYYRGKTP